MIAEFKVPSNLELTPFVPLVTNIKDGSSLPQVKQEILILLAREDNERLTKAIDTIKKGCYYSYLKMDAKQKKITEWQDYIKYDFGIESNKKKKKPSNRQILNCIVAYGFYCFMPQYLLCIKEEGSDYILQSKWQTHLQCPKEGNEG